MTKKKYYVFGTDAAGNAVVRWYTKTARGIPLFMDEEKVNVIKVAAIKSNPAYRSL